MRVGSRKLVLEQDNLSFDADFCKIAAVNLTKKQYFEVVQYSKGRGLWQQQRSNPVPFITLPHREHLQRRSSLQVTASRTFPWVLHSPLSVCPSCQSELILPPSFLPLSEVATSALGSLVEFAPLPSLISTHAKTAEFDLHYGAPHRNPSLQ